MALNTNNRIIWSVQAVGIAKDGSTSFTPVHGLQNVGTNTTFNLEEAFEIGQINIYEQVENVPDVEITLEKFLDGYPLIYHLSTPDANSATLAGRSNEKAMVALSVFPDDQDSASGTPNAQVTFSGMYVSSLSYTFPNDGFCSEAVTLVGNNKTWNTGGGKTFTGTLFNNNDQPLALTSGWGGLQRRENVVFGSGADGTVSRLPYGAGGIPGLSTGGYNLPRADGRGNTAHVNRVVISTDLGRENIFELGNRTPFFRPATFPTEVTTEIEILAIDGDLVSATEEGVAGDGSNLYDQNIFIVTDDSTAVDVGNRNKLQSVSYGGGDAGGGNATVTFTYRTFNTLTVTQDNDPAGL